jgi:Tetracyclin repressor-like, C-terminal domain
MPLAEVVATLTGYARLVGAPVRTATTVHTVRAVPEGFEILANDDLLRARAVVLATGACNRPAIPGIADAVPLPWPATCTPSSAAGLFTAAVAMDLQVPDLRSVSASRRGELLVRHFISRWEDPLRDDELIALLRTGVTSETVAERLQAVLGQLITEPIAALANERAAERGTLIAAQLLGLALCRYILRFEPLASLPADDVVAAVASSVYRYLTRPAASPSARRR